MENTFYNDFDMQCLTKERAADYRSPFEIDRDRIIHTSAFRRLQAKTQVFLSGEYDFYRTRLTHSLEVAQIGRSICKFLQHESPLLSKEFAVDSNLVEAICLSHDLGHPPFGHSGERTLNELMKPYGGFEGNAQTLRLITETIYSSNRERQGMNPTRSFLDGILKYKTPHGELENPVNHFIYDEQKSYVEFVFGGASVPKELSGGKALNSFRSIECQLMDWSDDAAYSLNDLADGIHSGIINKEKLERWASERSLSREENRSLEDVLDAISTGQLEKIIAGKIGHFIQACSLSEWKNFMSGRTNRYCFRLEIDQAIQREAELYKNISIDLVFRSPQLHQLEHKGGVYSEKNIQRVRRKLSRKRKFKNKPAAAGHRTERAKHCKSSPTHAFTVRPYCRHDRRLCHPYL